MDLSALFEKLAMTVHYDPELQALIDKLPPEIHKAFELNNSHRIRCIISNSDEFPDSKAVSKS
jgi:hypothetical protein